MTPDTLHRLIEEYTQLRERHQKLDDFMTTSEFKTLSDHEQHLLVIQRFIMFEYWKLLLDRINLHTSIV